MRLPVSLKANLKAIVKLWQAMAEAQGHDPSNIDMTFVCERLLRIGADGVWAQAGTSAGISGMPKTDDEWDRLVASIYEANGKTPPSPKRR